jgi:hypothetical protein
MVTHPEPLQPVISPMFFSIDRKVSFGIKLSTTSSYPQFTDDDDPELILRPGEDVVHL